MAYLDNVTNILQIQPDGLPTYVRLSQNENGRNLYFELQGNEADIPANATITISGTKPDGVVYSGTGSCTDNVVLIPETVQMTAVAGTWDAKIQITSGGNTIATGRVRFVVDADTVAPGSVPSDSELEGLVAQAQQYAETARTEAYGSPLTASTAAGMTDHTRVYVYTGSESGYTAGHWYFWNGSAWTDGGIYNSVAVNTDPTLKLSGVAADAKATGDAIAAVTIETDKTLSVSDAPADAKVVGDEIASLKGDLSDIEDEVAAIVPGLSAEAKEALLACFAHVAWTVDDGIEYYNDLASALDVEPTPSFNYGEYAPDELINGSYIDLDGQIKTGQTGKSFYIADYIPVVRSNYWIGMSPATTVFENNNTAFRQENNWRVSEYDENKEFIKQTQYSNTTNYAARIHTFENNTKFFRLGWYDPYSSTEKIFDIENPTGIIELPMVSGDYSADTGQPVTQAARIRTTGAIECAGTLTMNTCPFDGAWGTNSQGWNYMIRCYDANDSYLGSLTGKTNVNLNNEPLPTNTAKIKMAMQYYGATNPSSQFGQWVNRLLKINGQSYYVVKGT